MTSQKQAKELLALSRQQRRRIWIKNRKQLDMEWPEFEWSLQQTVKEKDE